MENIFILIGGGAGIYCLYAFYMMITKKEINKTILLPKDVEVYQCKDKDAYIKELSVPLLVLGIVLLLYGIVELLNKYVLSMGVMIPVALLIVFVVLIWFAVKTKKANKKYFGI